MTNVTPLLISGFAAAAALNTTLAEVRNPEGTTDDAWQAIEERALSQLEIVLQRLKFDPGQKVDFAGWQGRADRVPLVLAVYSDLVLKPSLGPREMFAEVYRMAVKRAGIEPFAFTGEDQ